MKVLIADALSASAREVFEARGLTADVKVGLTPEALRAVIGGYDGLAVRSATKVTAEVLDAAPRLKVIGRAGIGIDNIDQAAATRRGVVVMNTPFGNSVTTAEHAIAMMMACARWIPAANASTHAGKWEKSRFMGVELRAKVLGVVGMGNIGAIVAELALGLKMKVLAYDPFLSEERARARGVVKVDWEDLLAQADFITVHTPLTKETRGLINTAAIARMKPGVRIINCARGGIVDEHALLEGLESGKVAGAALDVFMKEPARENPLFGRDNVVCTPHLGASTEEAQENVAVQVARQISDYLLDGTVTNAVNLPSISAEEAPLLKPYLALARNLGLLAGQLGSPDLREVQVEYEGQAANLNTTPLTQALLAGLLKPALEHVNPVNARSLAQERGIAIREAKSDRACDYQTLIRVTARGKEDFSVTGTLLGGELPRTVMINQVPVEAGLSPHMLYIVNDDRPGLIGALGGVLGEAGINIATFHLGRRETGAHALSLLQLDAPLPDSVLARIRSLPLVRRAQTLSFDLP